MNGVQMIEMDPVAPLDSMLHEQQLDRRNRFDLSE